MDAVRGGDATESNAQPTPPRGEFDVTAFAQAVQQAARQLGAVSETNWRSVVEGGLREAYRQHDAVGLAAMVQVVVGFLDGAGRLEDVVREIDHALALARRDRSAIGLLEALRSCYLIALGDVAAGLSAADRAESCVAGQTDQPLVITRVRAHCAAARLFALNDFGRAEAEVLAGSEPGEAHAGDILYMQSAYIAFRYTRGERSDVRPWLRAFRLSAEAAQHEYRISDALTFERADAAITAPLELPPLEGMPQWNWLGRWRLQALRLRAGLARRDFHVAEEELAALMRVRRRAGSAKLDEIDGFEANVLANRDGELTLLAVPQPASVHLLNIASILAGAEAVAIAGSQAEAALWLSWLEKEVPPHVQTAVEWPVSRARVQGLVAVRAGDPRAARRWLEDAIRWTGQAGYPLERALAQVQLAELLHRQGSQRQESVRNRMRAEGWSTLRELGIDPAVHAYVVARPSPGVPTTTLDPGLTPREAEVLGLLAEGLTYKTIAERMGVAWPTVQVLAHRCYEKLGVSGRWAAVHYAEELGIL